MNENKIMIVIMIILPHIIEENIEYHLKLIDSKESVISLSVIWS